MDSKAEQYYPTYRFDKAHRDVVLAEFEAALAIANDQTRHYGLIANILLGVLALTTPFVLRSGEGDQTILRIATDNKVALLVVALLFSLILLRYFTELQKQIVYNARKVITLRLLLGLDYGTIHLTLPDWRVEGATNPFAVPLFPRWLSFGSVPFWTLLVANSLFAWSGLAPYSWRYWAMGALALGLTWFYRWSLCDRHETTGLAFTKGLAKILRLKLVGNFEYILYRATLNVLELDRLGVGYKALRKAVVAIEDRRYYEHGGIDRRALGRAFLSQFAYYQRKRGYIRSGGSTIPMQLVRTLFIVSGQPTWKRKLFELFLAPWISAQFTKSELLNMYIACVRYERGIMGLSKAIPHFFGPLKGKVLTNEEAFVLVERLSNVTSTVNMGRVKHLMERSGLELDAEVVERNYAEHKAKHAKE